MNARVLLRQLPLRPLRCAGCHREHRHHALPLLERQLHRIRQPPAHPVLHHEPVHHRRYRMRQRLRQRRHAIQLEELPVHLHPREPHPPYRIQRLRVRPLPPLHDRRENLHPHPVAEPDNLVDHLLRRLPRHRPPALRAVRMRDVGIQQPQVVVDFRRRRHDRPWIPARAALFNGNGRRQPVDPVHVRLLHLFEELPRIRRQALHVLPLPLRIERIERQRRLPAPAEPGDHAQRPARNPHRNVLEVVDPRPLDRDVLLQHGSSFRLSSPPRPRAPVLLSRPPRWRP